jgi:hypothetical protein
VVSVVEEELAAFYTAGYGGATSFGNNSGLSQSNQ